MPAQASRAGVEKQKKGCAADCPWQLLSKDEKRKEKEKDEKLKLGCRIFGGKTAPVNGGDEVGPAASRSHGQGTGVWEVLHCGKIQLATRRRASFAVGAGVGLGVFGPSK